MAAADIAGLRAPGVVGRRLVLLRPPGRVLSPVSVRPAPLWLMEIAPAASRPPAKSLRNLVAALTAQPMAAGRRAYRALSRYSGLVRARTVIRSLRATSLPRAPLPHTPQHHPH